LSGKASFTLQVSVEERQHDPVHLLNRGIFIRLNPAAFRDGTLDPECVKPLILLAKSSACQSQKG
jgi:hypothetical protein